MISEKRIHGGQVNPTVLDAFLAQEDSNCSSSEIGKNALKESSPHTLSVSFFLSSPECLVFGEQGTGPDGAFM